MTRKYYLEHRSERLAYASKRRKEHPEIRAEYERTHREQAREYRHEYRLKNLEKVRGWNRDFWLKNQERIRAENRRRYHEGLAEYKARIYKISVAEYKALLKDCGGRCPITGSDKLVIDHDHKTGKVRGLIDQRCNFILGLAHDDPKILRRLADYLEGNLKVGDVQ